MFSTSEELLPLPSNTCLLCITASPFLCVLYVLLSRSLYHLLWLFPYHSPLLLFPVIPAPGPSLPPVLVSGSSSGTTLFIFLSFISLWILEKLFYVLSNCFAFSLPSIYLFPFTTNTSFFLLFAIHPSIFLIVFHIFD